MRHFFQIGLVIANLGDALFLFGVDAVRALVSPLRRRFRLFPRGVPRLGRHLRAKGIRPAPWSFDVRQALRS
jgi:hypothetical protein